jgi:xanthine dehydrogenase accessory factor
VSLSREAAKKLVLRAPCDGTFLSRAEIGDIVTEGQMLGAVQNEKVVAHASGVLRGLVHDGIPVKKGMKLGDIDPSGDRERCLHISEKSNAIAGGVMEACLVLLSRRACKQSDVSC